MNENVKVDVKAKTLTMVVDLSKDLGPSVSGKTNLIAKCRELLPGGVTVQVNVFRKADKKKAKA